MSFVPMTSRDLGEVVALEQRIQTFPWTQGNFLDSLAAGYACWLGREEGRIVSFAVIMRAVDEQHLLDIGVAPEYQRQGRGTQLLDFLCVTGQSQGILRMLLEVRPSNELAIAFYRRHNFAEIGRRRGYYPALDGREDAIVMAKDL